MALRRSLKLPIILAVVMIVLLLSLIVGWVLLTYKGATSDEGSAAAVYWTVLPIGTVFLALVLVGVVIYLALSIKAINLTRRQSNFIDAVTHELKSPIASLKLYLQTLNLRQVSPEEQEAFYRFMLEDVDRLDGLINHVLAAGQLEKEPVDKDDVVTEVRLDLLVAQCAETVAVRYRVPSGAIQLQVEPCVLEARKMDLEIVLRNLIDNAVKYAGVPPEVQISLTCSEIGVIMLCVSDNGRGIPHPQKPKIFRRFVRLGKELERDKPGTGLGLYLVKTHVRRMKGRVTVHDRPNGPGTVFRVMLPGGEAVDLESDEVDTKILAQTSDPFVPREERSR